MSFLEKIDNEKTLKQGKSMKRCSSICDDEVEISKKQKFDSAANIDGKQHKSKTVKYFSFSIVQENRVLNSYLC